MDPFGTSATLGHTALDAAGFIPGVGNVFDAVNALWYLAQGDWTNAGLSAIAVIPIVGDVASGTKIAVKTVKAADEIAEAAKVAEKTEVVTLGKGSTDRTVANNLTEQLAMEEVKSNPLEGATQLTSVKMGDSRWSASSGWVKMSKNVNGVEVHYVYNTKTGAFDDFKFE